MTKILHLVRCPQCKKSLKWDTTNPYRPFCSERCKLIDLGAWASDEYAIPDKDQPVSTDDNDST